MDKSLSYNIAESLFNSMKGFVVLGLCGHTGSGCSTAASILHQSFSILQLPPPAAAPEDSISDAEQLILYNYAKQNWARFYLIRVSQLMTGYLLVEDKEDKDKSKDKAAEKFKRYLKEQFSLAENTELDEAIQNFFDEKMEFRVPAYYIEKLRQDYNAEEFEQLIKGLGGFLSGPGFWDKLFPSNGEVPALKDLDGHRRKEKPFTFSVGEGEEKESFTYEYRTDKDLKEGIVTISIKDMQRLLDTYERCRKNRLVFKNGFLSLLLCEYVYETLPKFASQLWEKIGKAQRGLPTVILQDIGINLRAWGKPLVSVKSMEKEQVKEDGFLMIAQRINLCLKILRDALQQKKEFREILLQKTDAAGNCAYAKSLELLDQGTQQVLVAIDSIKNPFESQYLKARYSSYYLVAMYTDENERRKRLEGAPKRLTPAEIDAIDTIEQLEEYKKYLRNKQEGESQQADQTTILTVSSLAPIREKLEYGGLKKVCPFIMQNVGHCIETADIFINNREDNQQRLLLKWNLVRYVSLIMNPGLVLPTAVERCMQIAQIAKVNSGCISRQVGAVLTDAQYRIRSVGWNDTAPGRVPCAYRDILDIFHHWSTKAYSDFENDDTDRFQAQLHQPGYPERLEEAGRCMERVGKRLPYCFKDIYNTIDENKNQVHPRSLHAEERAFLDLADQGGSSIKGGYLFTTSSPCELCAKKVCYMGISKVYYVEPYSGISGKHVMSDGPAEQRPVQELFTGAIGRAYTYLYTPILPKKDEIEMWLGHKIDGRVPEGTQKEVHVAEGDKDEAGGDAETIDDVSGEKGQETCKTAQTERRQEECRRTWSTKSRWGSN